MKKTTAQKKYKPIPERVCPVLKAFVTNWNHSLPDDEARKRLLGPFLPRLVGARATKAIEKQRSWLAADWLIRVCVPAFLELTPSLREHAQALSGLPPVLSRDSAKGVREKIDAARAAAGAAAEASVRAAAWDAAWDGASASVRDVAWAAAGDAAWDVAWAAAGADLQPAVVALQASAGILLSTMIELGE